MSRAFVTGGGGFLGQAIVRQLLARGDKVRTYSRGAYPELVKLGVDHWQGDLVDKDALKGAMAGCDVVYHVAARAGIWGSAEDFHQANVVGTERIVAACRRLGIARLVYTSSPSVVYHEGGIEGANESLPYPKTFLAHYPRTKAAAERLVLAANGPDLATVALRPHIIWGPGDHHFLPRLVARARAGRLRLLGKAPNLVDSIYVDNAARAHLLAADRLKPGARLAGKAYFLSQGQPLPLAQLMNRMLAAAGAPPVTRTMPPAFAYAVGAVLERAYSLLRIQNEPPMTRFLARQLSTPHWFDISAARRDLDYKPEISIDEGLKRLAEWCKAPK